MKKRIFGGLVPVALAAVLLVSFAGSSHAASLGDAQQQKDEAQEGLSSTESEIDEIVAKQQNLEEEIEKVDSELVEVIYSLNITKSDLEATRERLSAAQTDLEGARADEQEQYESMKTRIAYMYRNSDENMLVSLLSAGSITDILNQVSFYSDIYEYDRAALTKYQVTKQEIKALVAEVEEEEKNLEDTQADLEKEQERLDALKSEKQAQSDNYETELAKAEELAAQYQETIEAMNAAIEKYEAENAAQAAQAAQNASGETEADTLSGEETVGGGVESATDSLGDDSDYASGDGNDAASDQATVSAAAGSKDGQKIVNYALQFVGNPYAAGGTSLTDGCDSFGFTMQVYGHFGIDISQDIDSQYGAGYAVSSPQPGDLICYAERNGEGHVAIYIGGGCIVHAGSDETYPDGGIKVSDNYMYRTISSIRRLV